MEWRILGKCGRCGGSVLADGGNGWGNLARAVCAACGWDGMARPPTDEERRATGGDADEGLMRLLRAVLADTEIDRSGEVWKLIEPAIPPDMLGWSSNGNGKGNGHGHAPITFALDSKPGVQLALNL